MQAVTQPASKEGKGGIDNGSVRSAVKYVKFRSMPGTWAQARVREGVPESGWHVSLFKG